MQRVCVVGNLASGKSYFAKLIGVRLGLPVTHLDHFYWRPDFTLCSMDEFLSQCYGVLCREEWVMDGSYPEFNMGRRFDAADAVFYLDMPFTFCLKHMFKRRSKVRDDFPANQRHVSPALVLLIVARVALFKLIDGPFIMNAARNSETPFIRIRTWADEEAALERLCGG